MFRIIIWPVLPCEPFSCKTTDESPVWGPYAFARAGSEKCRTVLLQERTASHVKISNNFSPYRSCDKIVIDGKIFGTRFVRRDLKLVNSLVNKYVLSYKSAKHKDFSDLEEIVSRRMGGGGGEYVNVFT